MLGTILEITFNRELVDQSGTGNNTEGVSFNVFEPDDTQLIWYTVKTNPNLSNTITPLEFQEVTQNGVLGAASAQSYLDRFVETQPNYQDNYTITRTDNVVTITIINGEWNFDRTFVSDWVTMISSGPVNENNAEVDLTVVSEITGQQITEACTYCYLYEPLRVLISSSSEEVNKIFIALKVIDTATGDIVDGEDEFGNYDYVAGTELSIDLMKMARQYHNANVYNISNLTDITNSVDGWKSVISEYKYFFTIKTNISSFSGTVINKLPIIGGRDFRSFFPVVNQTQAPTEAVLEGLSQFNIWQGYPLISTSFADPILDDARPQISASNQPGGTPPCGGYLIWKSRYGGWMSWGFDIKTEKNSHKYGGSLSSELFEAQRGAPMVPVDYTGIETSYSITLKALGLFQEQLKVANSIGSSPAIYFYRLRETQDQPSQLELMRLTSFSAPITTLDSGGDFTVSLKSISSSNHKTR